MIYKYIQVKLLRMLGGELIKLYESKEMGCNWDENGIILGFVEDFIGMKLGSHNEKNSR